MRSADRRALRVEALLIYLDAAFEHGDPALIVAALGDIARARGSR